jgi:hypothetical protein
VEEKKGKASKNNSCHHGNWKLDEIFVLIDYKHKNNLLEANCGSLKKHGPYSP